MRFDEDRCPKCKMQFALTVQGNGAIVKCQTDGCSWSPQLKYLTPKQIVMIEGVIHDVLKSDVSCESGLKF
jgi:hypothetical protein